MFRIAKSGFEPTNYRSTYCLNFEQKLIALYLKYYKHKIEIDKINKQNN